MDFYLKLILYNTIETKKIQEKDPILVELIYFITLFLKCRTICGSKISIKI